MTIELMRRIDYWVGIPLCFLLTLINNMFNFLSFRKKRNIAPRKILFIGLSEMGSIILAYSLMKKAREEYPIVEMFFLTFKSNKPIFKLLDTVPYENVLTIREGPFYLFVLDTIKTISRMRKEKIDLVFDLELFSRFSAILTYLSKADKKVGSYRYHYEGLYRGNLLTHNVQHNALIHISKVFLSLWQAAKSAKKFSPELERRIDDNEIILPKVTSSSETKKQMQSRLREFGVDNESKVLLINPGDGRLPIREWPLENFILLSKMILEKGKNFIVIVGAGSLSEKPSKLYRVLDNKRCINFHNKTSLSELLALFDICDALIANDSGIAHIASLSNIKKFILFGPESPQIYSPLGDNIRILYSNLACSPCLSAFNNRSSACKNNKCLKIISPNEVFNLLKELL